MAGVEHIPGTRLLAVARRWDKCTVAVYVHRCSDDAARHLRAVVGQVVKSAATVQAHPRLTITDQKAGTIHYETDEHAIYVLVTEPSYPQRTAFRCLDEFRQRFRERFLGAMHKSAEGGLSRDARPLLAETCARFADAAEVDKVLGIQRDVAEVQGVMQDTVSRMLGNRENLQILEERAEILRSEGLTLAQSSRRVRHDMQSRHRRLQIIFCVTLTVLLLVVLLPVILSASAAGQDAYDGASERLTDWHEEVFGNGTRGS